MPDPILSARGLDAWYGGSHILPGVTFEAMEGERVALLGRNGAGKSTLMKALVNAGPRTEGEIRFEGRALDGAPPEARARDGLMLVPEDRRIYAHVTVAENIELGRFASGGRGTMTLKDVWSLFPLLEPLAGRAGYQLSGGQQQLVAVARGVFGHPRVLLLDEPVEGLAPVVVNDMAEQIDRLMQRERLTLIVSEQNLSFARRVTERLYLIDSGRIVFSGSWAEFDADPTLKARHLAV